MINKPNPLRYITDGSENKKNYFLLHFDPIVRDWDLSNGAKEIPLQQFSVWIDKLYNCHEIICAHNNGWRGNRRK